MKARGFDTKLSSTETSDTNSTLPLSHYSEPIMVGIMLDGQSGRRYQVERLLQDKHGPFGRVYLARCVPQKSCHKPMLKLESHSAGDQTC